MYYDPNVPLTAPALEPSAPLALSPPLGVYVVRNRVLLPHLGRWAQRDMNETALPILTALAMNGETLASFFGAFDAEVHYGDGLNLYAYAGSNPIMGSDPLGLDFFDEIDELISDVEGQRLYALGTLNEGAKCIGLGLKISLDIAASLLGLDVFQSIHLLAGGRGGYWDALNVVAAAIPVGGPLKAIGKAAKYGRRARAATKGLDILANLSKWTRGYDQALLSAARTKYPKLARKTHRHHVIPNYIRPEGIKSPIVKLDAAYHQLITNAFRKEWKYGAIRKPTVEELENILNRVYANLPLPQN